MARSQIKVNTSPVADHYGQHPTERIIEFDSPNGGGLVAFRMHDDGTLTIEPYRLDESVSVTAPSPGEYRGHYEIRESDVGRTFLKAFGRTWSLTDQAFGPVRPGDVGKRVYCIVDAGSTRGPGASEQTKRYLLQFENDDQRNRRLSTGEAF